MSDRFDRDAFLNAVAQELGQSFQAVERMAMATLMVASTPVNRSEKKESKQRLEKIRDAAIALREALESEEAQIISYFIAPGEWHSRTAEWKNADTIKSWVQAIEQASSIAMDQDIISMWSPYGEQWPMPPKGGRPVEQRTRLLADFLARFYAEVTKERPTFGTSPLSGEPSTRFGRLVRNAFASVGLEESWERAARNAMKGFNDETYGK